MDNCINQIVTAIAQVAAMLTQANRKPILPAVQELGVEIPCLEASH